MKFLLIILIVLLSGCNTNIIETCMKTEIITECKKDSFTKCERIEEFENNKIMSHLRTDCR